MDRETNRCVRWLKEAIWIMKPVPTMNRDEGGYSLSHVWDVCSPRHLASSDNLVPEEVRRWWLKR